MKSPAFQFYPADFLADENVQLMDNRETGCYIRLLSHCWIEGSIPSDVSKIARLCREDASDMAQLWTAISPCFVELDGKPGRLINPRLAEERRKQEEYRSERASSGAKGAKARWDKRSATTKQPANDDGSANGSANEQPKANDASSSPPSSIDKPNGTGEREGRPPGCVEWRTWYDKRFAGKYPREENGNIIDGAINGGMEPGVAIFVIEKLIGKAKDPLIYGSSAVANLFAADVLTVPQLMDYLVEHPEVLQVGRSNAGGAGNASGEAPGTGAGRERGKAGNAGAGRRADDDAKLNSLSL